MKKLTIILIIVISMILMTGVFSRLTMFGVQPDIMLVCLIAILCLDSGAFVLPVVGVCMLIVDSIFARAIGFYTIPYLMVGIAAYITVNKLNKKNLLVIFAMIVPAWVIKEIISCVLSVVLGYSFSFTARLTGIIIPGMLVTFILFAIVFPLLYILFGRAYMLKDANYNLNTLG